MIKKELFLYVVGASPDPDNIKNHCKVPFEVNDEIIFFGPCKKSLRVQLRKRFLAACDDLTPDEDIYIAGVNCTNSIRMRKILWAGKVTRIMTFETAWNGLTENKYTKMRSLENSPLHLMPEYDERGFFTGYEHCSTYHKDDWVMDVIRSKKDLAETILERDRITLRNPAEKERVFKRDCCFLCENIFFVDKQGVPITNDMVEILQEAQPRQDIDRYAIFGYDKRGAVKGLRNTQLHMVGKIADRMMDLIRKHIPN